MGTPIAAKNHTTPLAGTEKIPLSPDGYATTQEVADLGTGGGLTRVIANDEDVVVVAASGTTIVLYETLTDARTVTLPPAAGQSQIVIVVDVNELGSPTNTITLVPDGADEIETPLVTRIASITNNGDDEWTDLRPAFPIGPYDDGTGLSEITTENGIQQWQITKGDDPNVIARMYVLVAPSTSVAFMEAVTTDHQASWQVVATPGGGEGLLFIDSQAYIDAGGLDKFVTIRDHGGGITFIADLGLFFSGTIPDADPHVDHQVYADGYVQGVTPGVLMISAG